MPARGQVALVGCLVASIGVIVAFLSLSKNLLLEVFAIRSSRIASIRPHLTRIQKIVPLVGEVLSFIRKSLPVGAGVRIGRSGIVRL